MSEVPRVTGGAIRVGELVLDPRSGELRGAAGRQTLSAQPLQFLLALAEHPGELVTRDELRQRLWPADTYVDFEHGLNAVVKRLRDALGDAADTPRYIETVPRRGYRLVAAVDRGTPAPGDPSPERAEPALQPAASGEPPAAAELAPSRPRPLALVVASVITILTILALVGLVSPAANGLRRLTFGPGLQTGAAWSPDGRRIAFASDEDGTFDIFTQSVEGGEATRITRTPSNDTNPAWSPDGRRLVFRSDADGGGLFTVDATGGPAQRITNSGLRPEWMPDGRDIVFAGLDMQAIYLVRADGGEAPREALPGQLAGGRWASMAVHPDGRIGVLGHHQTMGFGFYVADPATGRLEAVDTKVALALEWQAGTVHLRWSPAGTALFVEAIAGGVPAIWRVPVDPLSLAWQPPVRLTTVMTSVDDAALSPDGSRLAFTNAGSTTRAWLFPFDADDGRSPGEGRALTAENASIGSLALSADGSVLCLAERRRGSGLSLGLRTDLDTGQTTAIGDHTAVPSRDGRSLAYLLQRAATGSTTGDREYALAVRDGDGRERLVVSWGLSAFVPTDWRQDDRVLGTMIGWGLTRPAALVEWPVGASAAASPSRVLLDDPTKQFWQGRYSPDARWVSFVAGPRGDANGGAVLEMGIAPAGSDRARTWSRIAADHAWPDKPRWSPDGKTLYFLSPGAAGLFNLWGVHVDPTSGAQQGAPFQVTHFDSPRWHVDPDMFSTEVGIAKGRLVLPMRSVTGGIWLLPTTGS